MSDVPYLSEGGEFRRATPTLNFEEIPVPMAGVFDSPTVYLCFNTQWASIIAGRLESLTLLSAWHGTAVEKQAGVDGIVEILAQMACEDCSQFITDVETTPSGQLRVKRGGVWVNATGSGTGDTTVINNQETLVQNMYPPPPVNTGLTAEVRACNIASGLEQWLFDKFEDTLVQVEATSDIIAAADGILGIFPPVYLVADQATDVVDEIVEATTNTLRAQYTTTQRDDIRCAIYVNLVATGQLPVENVAAIKGLIVDAISSTPLDIAIQEFLQMIDDAAMAHRAMLYQSVGSAINCAALCGSCTYFNSLQGWAGWSPITVGGNQTPPSIIDGHYEGTYVDPTGTNTVNCRIQYTMTAAFSSIGFNWEGNQTRDYGGGGTPAGARIYKNGAQVAITEVSADLGPKEGFTEYTLGVAAGDVIQVEVWFRVNTQAQDDPDARATITQVQFCP